MNVDLVIFDLDGVLVDACEWHRVALNEALMEVCGYEIPLEDHYADYNGLPTLTKLDKLSTRGLLPEEDHKKVSDLKQEKTMGVIEKLAWVREEKVSLLQALQKRGIRIGCCTNSIRKTTELMLEKTGIRHFFEYPSGIVITNQDVDNPKPHPEGYNKIIQYFDSKKTIIVEDSPKGLQAARASGAEVLDVKNPGEVTLDLFKDIII